MRIGGATRDTMMTLIPMSVAVVVTLYLLGGPEDALRTLDRVGYEVWQAIGVWFRR
jgi:hypothetical protein